MVTEIATITVAPGSEEAFEQAMREGGGLAALSACPGVRSVQFGRGVECPEKFAFVVVWDSIEAHAAAKDTESFRTFRAAFGTMAVGGAMDHFTLS